MRGDITRITAHRPWPLPEGPWIMTQVWEDLLFAHWPVPVAMLRPLIPPGLAIDTYDGTAWVGVVPFRMSGVRPRLLPPLPWLSAFPELNVRTYVVAEDKPGVWFFSLDAANPVAVALARATFHLPYMNARMLVGEYRGIRYESERTHRGEPPAVFAAAYRPCGPVEEPRPGTLEDWLTARYCLYAADAHGRLRRGEIHHLPWPLQLADATILQNTMAAATGIVLPGSPPLVHFARRLEVVVWRPTPVASRADRI